MLGAAAARCSRLSRKSSVPVPRSASAMRLDERALGGLAHADRSRDRRRARARVGDRREADEVHRALDGGRRRGLEREPALAGTARAR